jgi:hypothetical protein
MHSVARRADLAVSDLSVERSARRARRQHSADVAGRRTLVPRTRSRGPAEPSP